MKKYIILFFGLICYFNFQLYSAEIGTEKSVTHEQRKQSDELTRELFDALLEDPIDAQKIEKIINAGPNINNIDPETGLTPFTALLAAIATEYKEGQPIPEKFIKLIKLFLDQKDFDVNLPDTNGIMPFEGVMEFFHHILNQGICANNQDIKDILKLFLQHGANIKIKNNYFARLSKKYKIFLEALEDYLNDLRATKPEQVCIELDKLGSISEQEELLNAYAAECEFKKVQS